MVPIDVPAQLRAASLRVTAPRVAVLQELADHPHADADDLVAAVRERLGSVSVQAIYDVLRALGSAGLVRRIEPAGHPARYETRTGDNHHHVVCRSCGDVADVDCPVAAAPCIDPADARGFTVDEAEITYWGYCATCRTGHANAEPPAAAVPH